MLFDKVRLECRSDFVGCLQRVVDRAVSCGVVNHTASIPTTGSASPSEGTIIKRAEELSRGRVRCSYGLTDDPGAATLRAEAVRMAEAAQFVTRDGPPARAASREDPLAITAP